MLLTSLYFWDNTYNTFHLPCGMVTPTLFDAAAIVGLHPNGIDFDPTVLNEDTIAFETSLAPYSLFMSYYHDKTVRIPTKKTSVEASPSAAKKHSTKAIQKPPTIQKRKSEEEKEKDKVPHEESGDESPELIPPPQKKKKLTKVSSQRSIVKSTRKDSTSTPPAKPQSKDTESAKSSFNTEIPEEQVAVERTPEKILEEITPEEDIPTSDHDMQTVAEFDTTVGEASEDESPPHPGLNAAPQGDDIDMEAGVEDDPEDEAAKDGDNQSKQTEVEHTSERNTPPAPDQTQRSGKSTGFFAEQFDHFWGNF
ncbi:uncharacterized protein LOC127094246 [Lathyrus oleraceus]|uniref:uncharacterized protein LOC127094246 n=1 Tax=Pisum sativum TaxID=3888 RepID=UPI0021D1797E|nr:uncharacterized protein LOC127094246 [Pisum sativum]